MTASRDGEAHAANQLGVFSGKRVERTVGHDEAATVAEGSQPCSPRASPVGPKRPITAGSMSRGRSGLMTGGAPQGAATAPPSTTPLSAVEMSIALASNCSGEVGPQLRQSQQLPAGASAERPKSVGGLVSADRIPSTARRWVVCARW